MRKFMVNWVKEDEELLEPYEWSMEDDIEYLYDIDIYRIDDTTLHAFIYGCLQVQEETFYNRIFAVSDTTYCIIVEIDSTGTLIYRGLTTYAGREYIRAESKALPITAIPHTMYDEGMMKEYGLTRSERLKKQYIENMIDDLYVDDYVTFLQLCQQVGVRADEDISLYIKMKKKIEKGYTFIHELLYAQLSKIQ